MDRKNGFDINSLRQQFEDLLEDFFPSGGARKPQQGRGPSGDQPQHLPVNLADSEAAYIVHVPLPGLSPEEIDITVRGQALTIKAQHKTAAPDAPPLLRREWGYAPLIRTIELPGAVDADAAAAAYRNGVVTLTLPKVDPNKARVIPLEEEPPAQPKVEEETETIEVVESPEQPAPESVEPAAPPAEAEAEAPTSFYMRPPRGRRGSRPRRGQTPAPEAPAAEQAPSTAEPPAETPAEQPVDQPAE